MHDTITDDLQPALVRWTMGGAAAALAPEYVKARLGDAADEAELRLLVVAGQALGTLVVPEPSGELKGLPDLPPLALPTVPDYVRPLASRLLASRDDWTRTMTVRLLASRGYVVHPADWMPGNGADVPDVYAPWQDWLRGMETGNGRASPEWSDLGPSGRISMLASLRRTDPAAALALASEKIGGESPERRVAMVQILGKGLSEADRPFLESLAGDRASSVRTAAARLLARMPSSGAADTAPDDVQDLLRVETRGMLRRQRAIAYAGRLNRPQEMRLAETLQNTTASRLATTLGIADVDLPGMWPWGQDAVIDQRFATMLAQTGSDAVMASLDQAVDDGAAITLITLNDGLDRISRDTMVTLTRAAVERGERFMAIASTTPLPGTLEEYDGSSEWRTVLLDMKRGSGVTDGTGQLQLASLGVLVTARAASEIVSRLTEAGMPLADPRLDMLRLNAAL